MHQWKDTPNNIKNANKNRILYQITHTNFIASLDIQHGDFEIIDKNNKKYDKNHLGSVSFDKKRFKKADANHGINIP